MTNKRTSSCAHCLAAAAYPHKETCPLAEPPQDDFENYVHPLKVIKTLVTAKPPQARAGLIARLQRYGQPAPAQASSQSGRGLALEAAAALAAMEQQVASANTGEQLWREDCAKAERKLAEARKAFQDIMHQVNTDGHVMKGPVLRISSDAIATIDAARKEEK